MIKEIFDELFREFGARGWWPVTPHGKTKPEYHQTGHSKKQRLEIIFGAILTQNTSWRNVEKAISQLHRADMIDLDRILKVKEERLAQLIRSSGYFNQKAKKLKNVARFFKEHSFEEIEAMDADEARDLLLTVNGVGPETADSILLYAFNKPIFVVDKYTKRMLVDRGVIDESAGYDEIQRLFMEKLPKNSGVFKEFHALIVEYSKKNEKFINA